MCFVLRLCVAGVAMLVLLSVAEATHVDASYRCHGRVAEWQTRWLQVPVSLGTWGFKSPFAHSERFTN